MQDKSNGYDAIAEHFSGELLLLRNQVLNSGYAVNQYSPPREEGNAASHYVDVPPIISLPI